MRRGEKIGVEKLSPLIAAGTADTVGSLDYRVEDFERQVIEQALRQSHGVMAQAAKLLKIERTRLMRTAWRLGIRSRREKHNPSQGEP